MSLLQIMRTIARNHHDFRHEEQKPSGAVRETFAFSHDGADLAKSIASAGDYPILQYHPERGTIERGSDLTTKVLASFSVVRRESFEDADAVATAQKDNLRNGQQILILLENMQEDGKPALSGFEMDGTRWEHGEVGGNNIVKTTFFLNLSHSGVSPYEDTSSFYNG